MGFFSWKTSDTNESIFNEHTDRCNTVYLLQPNGEPSIEETSYDGYGRFGNMDAYEWLARKNLPKTKAAELEAQGNESLRLYGIQEIAFADRYLLKETNETFSKNQLIDLPEINFETKQERFNGRSINELIESKEMITVAPETPIFPLKFSFNKNAVYEHLPAAQDCPNQGFFEPDDIEE